MNKLDEQKLDEFLTALAGLAGRGLAGMGARMTMAGGRMAAPAMRAQAKKANLQKTMQATKTLRSSPKGGLEGKNAARTARNAAVERINQRRKDKGRTDMMKPGRNLMGKEQYGNWKRSARFEWLVQDIRNKLEEGLTTGTSAYYTGERVGKATKNNPNDPRVKRIQNKMSKKYPKHKLARWHEFERARKKAQK